MSFDGLNALGIDSGFLKDPLAEFIEKVIVVMDVCDIPKRIDYFCGVFTGVIFRLGDGNSVVGMDHD